MNNEDGNAAMKASMAEVLMQMGRNEQAVKCCNEALAVGIVKEGQKAGILVTKGRCLERQGMLEESLGCFEEAMKIQNKNGMIGNQRIHIVQEIKQSI